MSVNKVMLIGRLGSDPDMKYTTSGIPVTKFSLATSEYFVDKGGQKQETTEWHKIVCWNKLADNCSKYLAKGRLVYVEGKITTVSWDDKQSGQKRYATEIVAATVQFLGDGAGKPQGQEQPQPQQQHQQRNEPPQAPSYDQGPVPGLDDIPF